MVEYDISNIVTRDFYNRNPETVAKALLGKLLVRKLEKRLLIGKIVETEAYLPFDDPAAHSFVGKTKRNEVLFGEPGFTYVHSIHRYFCIDIVAQEKEVPGSVLIRALEPIEGIEIMQKNRGKDSLYDLTSGPGRLCQAFGITRAHNGIDVTSHKSDLFIVDAEENIEECLIEVRPRVGISKAKDKLLRFSVKGNKFVSR